MSNMEDRLRDAFRADAQTVPPHIVRPFESPTAWRPDRERQARERRVLVPLAAAAALALIVGGAVVAPKIWPRSDHNNAAAAGLASGFPGGKVPAVKRPAYLVAVVPRDGSVFKAGLAVISTRTGRVTSTIAPSPGEYYTAVVAANGQFIAEETSTRKCETWFYGFGLARAGVPTYAHSAYYSPAPGFPTEGYDSRAGALAVTPDQKVLAYSLSNCKGAGGVVGVFRSESNRATLWRYVHPAQPESLSLKDDGSLLGLVSNPSDPHAGITNPKRNAVWALRTTGRGGSLQRSYRRAVKPSGRIVSAALTPTGAVTIAVTQSTSNPGLVTVTAYQTSTGKRMFVLANFRSGKFDDGPSISLDPTGRYALLSDWQQDSSHPSGQHPVEGFDVVTGVGFAIPGTAADQAVSTAW